MSSGTEKYTPQNTPAQHAHTRTQQTAEDIASRYPGAKRISGGWQIHCPCHDDRSPSLSLYDKDGGGVHVECHAGCDYKDVRKALGIDSDWTRRNGQGDWKSQHIDVVYKHPDGLDRIQYREDHDGPCWRNDCTKTYPHKHTWVEKGRETKGTLVKVWNDDADATLVAVEGGKTARALEAHTEGLPYAAVTWYLGGTQAAYSDWSAVEGRSLIIWPDNDATGRKAVTTIARAATDAGVSDIRVVDVSGLGKGDDAADVDGETARKLLQAAQPYASRVITRDSWGFDAALKEIGIELRLNERSDAIQFREHDGAWLDLNGRFRSYNMVRIAELLRFEKKTGERVPAKFPRDDFSMYLEARAVDAAIDPFRQWLESLPAWDGKPRIESLFAEVLPAKHPELGAWAARAIITGAIARTYDPGCEFSTFPLLIGHIGVGKSLIGRLLVPDGKFYTDSLQVSATDKECIEQAAEAVIVELSELAALTKRGTEHFKAFATRTVDRARLAFRMDSSQHPRHWVCYGTSNHTARGALLNDESGNRRVLVVVVGPEHSVDADAQAECGRKIAAYMEANREQLWAEGLNLYRTAENKRRLYAPDASLWALQREDEEDATQSDPVAEEMADYALDVLFNQCENKITFEDILLARGLVNTVANDDYKLDTPSEKWVSEAVRLRTGVSAAMVKRGFSKRRGMTEWGKRTYFYL